MERVTHYCMRGTPLSCVLAALSLSWCMHLLQIYGNTSGGKGNRPTPRCNMPGLTWLWYAGRYDGDTRDVAAAAVHVNLARLVAWRHGELAYVGTWHARKGRS